ncbi:hypothetical protein [Pseudobacteriovorax antillogorgiicola]|uniref:Uncharacterized protein n=1 Tax=Pseudobacteriovorax antillogorgiicola TaxID=1513793 RepID=A0A1Y6BV15_9BACT|nr:hypothetical protein [Pseudobacteriovorax antillogorgiicola]TCS52433.1 hypothetical protein EDD56_109178 [Pseudobacteriovorax antillogorgiicola]SMF28719.1 hypothetical protein SAMN06296036_10935 [Pseudobacteriovorax antillogorgiicola]
MSIYFRNRELSEPLYKNKDYLTQQSQFITILRMKTSSFSMKVGTLHIHRNAGKREELGYLHIDLKDLKNVKVGFPDTGERICIHELFKVWSANREAEMHTLPTGYRTCNLEEFLGTAHDILTVKFRDDWKRAG